MSFAHPIVLTLLLALPLLTGVKLLADTRGKRAVTRLLSPRLRPSLVHGSGAASAWIAHLFELLAIALVIVSIARPQWGFSRQETEAEGRDILIALDTSRSMLADDLQPSRLLRARLVAQDLVDSMPNDRFGLLAFAGRAFLQAPLTIDHAAIAETLNQIDHDIIPRGGSNLAEPIQIAVELFEKSETGDHALVLFTDGDELEGETIKAARAAKEAGIMVVAVGVGTAAGSLIPDPDAPAAGTFIRDEDGNPVRTRLERASLEQIAQITGGAYLNIGTGSTTQKRIADALKKLESTARARKDTRRPIERYQWFLTAAFITMTISLLVPAVFQPSSPRRTSAAVTVSIALALLLLPAPGHAAQNPRSAADALAMQAYRSGKFDVATQLYAIAAEDPAAAPTTADRAKLHFGYASSAYKSGDHDEAIDGFAKALRSTTTAMQEDAHYNLGNTLFRRGQTIEATLNDPEAVKQMDIEPEILFEAIFREWEDAIEHYDAALELNPDNSDAAFNKDIVERNLERLKQQQQQQQQQQQEGEGEGEGEQEGQQGEGENEGKSGENGKGDKGQQGDENQGESGDNPDQDGDGKNDFENPMEEGGGEDGKDEKGPDGKLEALDKGKRPEGEQSDAEAGAGKQKQGEPGFTKSQARQVLRIFADEDTQVRPPMRIQFDDDYKNW